MISDWHSIVEREKFADAVLICTPDRLHKVILMYILYLCCCLCSHLLVWIIWKLDHCSVDNHQIKLVCVFQEPAVAFAKKGYHVLLEKPMAVSALSIIMNIKHNVHFDIDGINYTDWLWQYYNSVFSSHAKKCTLILSHL